MIRVSRRVVLAGVALVAALGAGVVADRIERRRAPPPAVVPEIGRWRPTVPPRPLPALAFADGDGRPLTAEAWRGRVVLLNLWATWCVPCVEEMPALDRLQARLGGPDFEVVALALDRQGIAVVKPFVERLKLARLALYLDPTGATTRALGARGLPTSLLIDREGSELGRVEGAADWDGAALERVLRAAIART